MKVQPIRRLRQAGSGLVLASLAGLSFQNRAQAQRAPSEAVRARADEARSTLRFEPNQGQLEERVRYLARGRGYALYLERTGATLVLSHSDRVRSVLSMRIVGGRDVEPTGEGPLSGASNYFVGSQRSSWTTGVQNYRSVRYENVLPGVTAIYYGSAGRELEYDLVLAPGANPRGVELAFEGAESMRIESDGSVVLRLPGGDELRKPAPVAYQLSDSGTRIAIASRYELRGGAKLGFAVGAYDSSRELRIDPVLLYSTYLGGSSYDQAYGAATDPAGNTYLVGYTSSTLFPTIDPLQATLAGGVYDAFVCKLSPTGSILYATFLGGKGADLGYAIAADALGNAYVAGVTFSTDFPTVSPLQASAGGKQDAFVAKLNANGAALVYSTYLGGSQDDFAQGIAVNAAGNAFVAGTSFSNNFPTALALQPALNGTSDAFLSKLTASGSSLVYATFLGGSNGESAQGVAVDSAGNATVVGFTGSNNYPLAAPVQATFGGGTYDAFVSKFNVAGSTLLSSTYLGGAGNDEASGVAVQANGQATVVGSTFSANFPIASAQQPNLASAGHSDAFVTRFTPSGTGLAFSTFLGGSGDDRAGGVGVDSNNSAYVVGSTDSSNFPQARSIPGQSTYHGAIDGFVTAVDPSGSPFYYSTYLGGSDEDHAVSVAVQAGGLTHVVGNTSSTNFPVQSAPISTIVGAQDGFVTRLPGIPVGVPANNRWNAFFLASLLLGVGLLGASVARKQHA